MSDATTAETATDSKTIALSTELAVPVEETKIAEIKARIKPDDTASLSDFGEPAQRQIADFADQVLRETINRDAGSVGDMLSNVLEKLDKVDPSALQNVGFFGRLFGGIKKHVNRFVRDFENVADQIDHIVLGLEKEQDRLKRDIAMLDGLYDANLDHLAMLEAYIVAGEAYVADARATRLPELEKAAAEATEADAQFAGLKLQDFRQALDRLEARIHDLKLSRTVALQSMPQIRIIQRGNATLIEKLGVSIHTAIPTWKSQMTIALSLHRQQGALEMQKTVTETTNQLLKENADLLKEGAVEIEKANQEGLVSIETLKHVNQSLVDTINEVRQIQEQGRRDRVQAEQDLKRIEGELREALVA